MFTRGQHHPLTGERLVCKVEQTLTLRIAYTHQMFSDNNKTQWREAFGALRIRQSPKASTTLAASIDDGNPQAERLERMKSEFLVAQQRRREKSPESASRSEVTEDGPLQAGPADATPTGIAAVRP